jgi:glycosyltransferase involved in cell wall biosynthesis
VKRRAATSLTAAGRRILQSASDAAERRRRQIPKFAVEPGLSSSVKIYYLCPSPPSPSGGVRNIYRHVDILSRLGFSATVVHEGHYVSPWFDSGASKLSAREVTLHENDIVVVSDYYGPGLHKLAEGPRYVIFNQGAHYAFNHIDFATTRPGAPYVDVPNLVGLMTVSEDSAGILRFAYPDLRVEIARVVVDADVFFPGTWPRPRRLVFLTHRRPDERDQLLHLIRAAGVLGDWSLLPIEGQTESRTAELLRTSPIFLSFSARDGFGLPPAEAMASGCFVVGYPGMGGREFFDVSYCLPIPDGDLLAYGRAIAQTCATYSADPEPFKTAGCRASEAIHSRYSESNLEADLRSFFNPLC